MHRSAHASVLLGGSDEIPEPLQGVQVADCRYYPFGYVSGVIGSKTSPPIRLRVLTVWAPIWVVALALAAYPALALIRGPFRRRHRRKRGWCVKCGDDLTGNVSGACPECGDEIDRP